MSPPAPYPPHGVCWFWDPALVPLHAVSDALIFLAYIALPWLMLRVATVADAGDSEIAFPRLRKWWVAFILCCGLTHLGEVVLVWRGGGWFWAVGAVKAIAAAVSIGAFTATWRRRHRIMSIVYLMVDAARRREAME